MAKRRCPIEMEPRTLNQGQLTLAREVAVDIFHKGESGEGSQIFTKGLKPVSEIKAVQILHKDNGIAETEVKSTSPLGVNTNTCCQCLRKFSVVDTREQTNLKEPVSAPF